MPRTVPLSEVLIRYISEKTVESTIPQTLSKWCATFKGELPNFQRTHGQLVQTVRDVLKKIETVTYLDFLQKVQILFVLQQPVSSKFKTIILDKKCELRLDERGRIQHFCYGEFERNGTGPPKAKPRNGNANRSNMSEEGDAGQSGTSQEPPIQPQNVPEVKMEEPLIVEYPENDRSIKDELLEENEDEVQGVEEQHRERELRNEMAQEEERRAQGAGEDEKIRAPERRQEQFGVPRVAPYPKRRQCSTPTEAKRCKPSEVTIPAASGLPSHDLKQSGPQAPTQQDAHLTSHQGSGASSTPTIPRTNLEAPTPQPSREKIIDSTSSSFVTPPASQIQTINVGRFAEQFETLAESFGFTDLEKKAYQLQGSVENQKIVSLTAFTYFVRGILSASEDEKVQNYQGASIKTLLFFKRFRNFLIRPLGDESIERILKHLDEKITKMENENDQSILAKERVYCYLESLLDLVTKN